MDGWLKEGRERGREGAGSYYISLSIHSNKYTFSQSKFLHIPLQWYFDNHARNDNLSKSSFCLPFKGNSSTISEKELPWIMGIKDIRAQSVSWLRRESTLCRVR